MDTKKRIGIAIGVGVAVLAIAGGAAAVAIAVKNRKREYDFYPGLDYSWDGTEDSLQITPYVSDEETMKTCDSLNGKDGERCLVAVRWGDKVYYRPRVLETPHDWKNTSPSPATDGCWVVKGLVTKKPDTSDTSDPELKGGALDTPVTPDDEIVASQRKQKKMTSKHKYW